MPIVPPHGARPPVDVVQNGAPVRGSDWSSAGAASNWLAGTGRQLVPGFKPDEVVYVWAGTSGGLGNNAYPWRFRFRLRPSIQAIERIWTVRATSGDPVGFTVGTGGTATIRGSSAITISERLASQSSADVDTFLEVSPTASMQIDHIGCFELTRRILDDDSTELGVIQERLRSGQPVQDAGIERLLSTSTDDSLQRRTLLNWATAYSENGNAATTYVKSTTSSTFSDLFDTDFPVLGRKLYTGETVRPIGARVYGWVSSGGGGEIRLKSSENGQLSTTVSLSNTYIGGGIWSTEMVDQDIDCEDTAVVDGRRGGAWDMMNIEFRATAGTLYIASATVYEL